MDRLSTLDAEFLHVEDGIAHMHIAGVCVFENPAPSIEEVRALVESKLHLIPRYRQRISTVPLELGRPVWVDDPHFLLDYHVRHTALPAPGGDTQLEALMGRLMSQPLDRDRPLWEGWLVDGLAGDRWALIFKVHHCMVDGIAGVELLTIILSTESDASIGEPEPWQPEHEPRGIAKVLDAWGGLAGDLWGWACKIPHLVVDPVGTARGLRETAEGLAGFLHNLTVPPRLSIEGTIGARRAWASSSSSFDDVRTIRAAFGGTINDVVLAAVTGGYRDLLISRGEDPDTATVRTAVPVSVRAEDAHGVPDNRVSTLLYELPVDVADPVERLAAVHGQVSEIKESHMAEVGEALTSLGNLVPPMVIGAVSRLAMSAEHLLPQRVINTVTTNVPGPQFPLYCLGREMKAYLPFVPITHGIRIGTAILSYNGRLFFGVTGDYDTASDVDVVADGTSNAITELAARAVAVTQPAAPRRRAPRKGPTKKGSPKQGSPKTGSHKTGSSKQGSPKQPGATKPAPGTSGT